MQRIYCCIDLKSFYASVECVERGLDPFKINLVVADPERSKGTICLAISPAMKALGIKNRCRIYEIPKNVEYIVAKPRMKLYMQKSAQIYSIYLKYISPDDIHVYSVDECFIDLTDYVKLYGKTAKELAATLMNDVYEITGIRATVGIGTNLFLAKVALDITAKHAEDFTGYLDEDIFRQTIWRHKPITDIWGIGRGTASRLARYGIYDLYGIAHFPEKTLYKEFGVNAELLIDHANGVEPCLISDIKRYKAKSNSLSRGQVLFSDYSFDDARTVLKEMIDQLVLELIDYGLVAGNVSVSVGYSDRLKKRTGGSEKLNVYTDSFKKLSAHVLKLYDQTTDRSSTIRNLNIGFNDVLPEKYATFDLLTDVAEERREKTLQKTVIGIKKKFGKNALLKGTSYTEKATARERNKMIGGHNGGNDQS